MQEDNLFAAPSTSRLKVMRDGRSIIRSAAIPKPIVLVDTREREPFLLYANHRNWIGGERRATMKTGDYTVEGMELKGAATLSTFLPMFIPMRSAAPWMR